MILFAMTLATLQPIPSEDSRMAVYGAGMNQCTTWTADAREPSDMNWPKLVNLTWVLGFVTGVNSTPEHRNVVADISPAEIEAWIDRYCAANPNAHVGEAARAFVTERGQQRPRR